MQLIAQRQVYCFQTSVVNLLQQTHDRENGLFCLTSRSPLLRWNAAFEFQASPGFRRVNDSVANAPLWRIPNYELHAYLTRSAWSWTGNVQAVKKLHWRRNSLFPFVPKCRNPNDKISGSFKMLDWIFHVLESMQTCEQPSSGAGVAIVAFHKTTFPSTSRQPCSWGVSIRPLHVPHISTQSQRILTLTTVCPVWPQFSLLIKKQMGKNVALRALFMISWISCFTPRSVRLRTYVNLAFSSDWGDSFQLNNIGLQKSCSSFFFVDVTFQHNKCVFAAVIFCTQREKSFWKDISAIQRLVWMCSS